MSKRIRTEAMHNKARIRILNILKKQARHRSPMCYLQLAAELNRQIPGLAFIARDKRMSTILCEISEAEYGAGRGMLSAVIVHKSGDRLPGIHFFNLAEELGCDTTVKRAFWKREFDAVCNYWGRH